MRKILSLALVAIMAAATLAQEHRPVRTPEEEASHQTEMLGRELNLSRQQTDTIYRIHLKYAKLRQKSNTRQEMLERMNSMTQEILGTLTKEQRKLFLSKQMDPDPHRPQVRRINRDSIQGAPEWGQPLPPGRQ